MAALQPGDSLAHFRIIDLLGAGRMGEVYLAEDERLQRKVALKLLPSGLSGDAERVRRFEREARAASALNHPNIGEAHAYQSLVSRINDWQFAEAERRSTRSMELEPDHPAALLWRGVHLLATGRAREALDVHRRTLEIDPLDLSLRAQLSRACYLTKQYDEAITVGRALIQLDEAQSPAHQWVGSALSALGRHADAFVHLERALQLAPKSPERQATLAHGYALGGRQADARQILGSLQLVPGPMTTSSRRFTRHSTTATPRSHRSNWRDSDATPTSRTAWRWIPSWIRCAEIRVFRHCCG